MRPLITLLTARMLHDEQSQQAMQLAAITEMLHTATLVHDDVIDASGLRRGKCQLRTPLGIIRQRFWWGLFDCSFI